MHARAPGSWDINGGIGRSVVQGRLRETILVAPLTCDISRIIYSPAPRPLRSRKIKGVIGGAVVSEAVSIAAPVNVKTRDHARIVDARWVCVLRSGRSDVGVSPAGIEEAHTGAAAVGITAYDIASGVDAVGGGRSRLGVRIVDICDLLFSEEQPVSHVRAGVDADHRFAVVDAVGGSALRPGHLDARITGKLRRRREQYILHAIRRSRAGINAQNAARVVD